MTRTILFAATLAIGGCLGASDQRPGSGLPEGTWRGDVSYPGLPAAIGVQYVIDDGGATLIAAPNMGFGGGPLEGFEAAGDSIRFAWSLNGDRYDCALRRQEDGVFLGPCVSPNEPTFGMRMVPPGIDVPTGLARTLLEMSSVQWVPAARTEHATVRVAAEHRTRVPGDDILASIAIVRDDNAALFGDVARTLQLNVFFTGERERMARLVGRGVGGWTDPMSGTVALVGYGENEVALRHEITHAISFGAWGPPRGGAGWLAEGLATWVAGACHGYDVHELAIDMRRRGELLPVAAVIGDFAEQDDVIAYLQAGSMVGFLLERHGTAAFRRVWTGGVEELPGLEGVAELEQTWLAHLDASGAASPTVDWPLIRLGGCG